MNTFWRILSPIIFAAAPNLAKAEGIDRNFSLPMAACRGAALEALLVTETLFYGTGNVPAAMVIPLTGLDQPLRRVSNLLVGYLTDGRSFKSETSNVRASLELEHGDGQSHIKVELKTAPGEWQVLVDSPTTCTNP